MINIGKPSIEFDITIPESPISEVYEFDDILEQVTEHFPYIPTLTFPISRGKYI